MAAQPQPNPGQLIEFHSALEGQVPSPFPASRAIPDWYKELPIEAPGPGPNPEIMPTIKRCPPFLEAITCGYIIPLAGDVIFTTDERGNLSFQATGPVVQTHPAAQYRSTPFASKIIVKFMNPWVIRTPPGYSTLLVPALNRFQNPFLILSGLVETDTYYREVHFPAICHLPPNAKFPMKRGTPLVQAIPILREPWRSISGATDDARRMEVEKELAANMHAYKDEHWRRKSFE
ncbi:MAG TPA: DUF6065 family protein [Tepidisphaeraceae bacterium]|jgi:hypothetical protein|nr:DUF6065 family protein [Tepidisphaeraceae bacterium]